MKKKFIVFAAIVAVFGIAAIAFAMSGTANHTAKAETRACCAMKDCCEDGKCKMGGACCADHKQHDAAKTETAENHSCAMADCCKDGKCKMGGACCKHKKDSAKTETAASDIDLTNVVVAGAEGGENCCQPGADCCNGGSCCHKNS